MLVKGALSHVSFPPRKPSDNNNKQRKLCIQLAIFQEETNNKGKIHQTVCDTDNTFLYRIYKELHYDTLGINIIYSQYDKKVIP